MEEDQFMGIKRHKPAEIVTKLRQVEVLAGRSPVLPSLGVYLDTEPLHTRLAVEG